MTSSRPKAPPTRPERPFWFAQIRVVQPDQYGLVRMAMRVLVGAECAAVRNRLGIRASDLRLAGQAGGQPPAAKGRRRYSCPYARPPGAVSNWREQLSVSWGIAFIGSVPPFLNSACLITSRRKGCAKSRRLHLFRGLVCPVFQRAKVA